MAASTLPRFTDIKKEQDLLRQQRRASHMPTSQPFRANTQGPVPNGETEVLEIDESSSDDDDSSADEGANKTVTPSQKKRRSVMGYFSQA
ncbi:hypothetical protein FRC12_016284 [Ceratobasidium sp. 428]|nr:hypothetical protein FRC12_016284 [Ceratobasidium sp. 428]